MEPNNTTAASHSLAFTCFNVNCYAMFKTECCLCQRLLQNAPCHDYMMEPRPLAAAGLCIVHESSWCCQRLGYGIESSRLNPFMCADPPSYEPYEVFNYSSNYDEDNGIDEQVVMNSTRGIGDVAVCCPVFHSKMECIPADDRHAMMVLHHDVEHQNIVNLLKLL